MATSVEVLSHITYNNQFIFINVERHHQQVWSMEVSRVRSLLLCGPDAAAFGC